MGRTQCVMCVSVLGIDGSLIGVVQAINKHNDNRNGSNTNSMNENICAFNEHDEKVASSFCTQIAVAVTNAKNVELSKRLLDEKTDALFNLEEKHQLLIETSQNQYNDIQW